MQVAVAVILQGREFVAPVNSSKVGCVSPAPAVAEVVLQKDTTCRPYYLNEFKSFVEVTHVMTTPHPKSYFFMRKKSLSMKTSGNQCQTK